MKITYTWALVCCFFAAIIFPAISVSQTKVNKSNPYKQILIPLDKLKGVPFNKDHTGEYTIEGFEIDNNENFFFWETGKRSWQASQKMAKVYL